MLKKECEQKPSNFTCWNFLSSKDPCNSRLGLKSSSTRDFLRKIVEISNPAANFDLLEDENEEYGENTFYVNDESTLPSGIAVIENLKKFLNFLKFDYHFFLYDELLINIDKIYSEGLEGEPAALSQFCLVMSLGAIYHGSSPLTDEIPGYLYFKLACHYLPGIEHSFSLVAIQSHILFAWYFLILNKKGLASVHSSIAIRKALCIGLHKWDGAIRAVEREHRSRTWWTAFVTDIFCVSILGTPHTICIDAIDVALPSNSNLNKSEKSLFFEHNYFALNVRLALITSKVISEVYKNDFEVASGSHLVTHALECLHEWKSNLPLENRRSFEDIYPIKRRDASLHLFYNQTVILATRPVLLYYFRLFCNESSMIDENLWKDSHIKCCVTAAKSTIKILSYCKANKMISTFGFYDSHYIYSAILVIFVIEMMRYHKQGFYEVLEPLSILQFQSASGNLAARSMSRDLHALFQFISLNKGISGSSYLYDELFDIKNTIKTDMDDF
ncbi:uncharacterized protein PRCAT00002475001 [Priceomyces carsonii]|uniref:uncharacterized protein n=1 Tax=Priceomyces carsonii TaxID=28549 RepID=UPI002ED7B075|nr:unnamed protein product [Priceomyces carsonii]